MSSEPRDVRPAPASPAPAELPSKAELAGLPGTDRPFAREDLDGDDTSWAAFRLMKNNKVIPAWSQAAAFGPGGSDGAVTDHIAEDA